MTPSSENDINIDPTQNPANSTLSLTSSNPYNPDREHAESVSKQVKTQLLTNRYQQAKKNSLVHRFFDARASSLTALGDDTNKDLLISLSSDESFLNNCEVFDSVHVDENDEDEHDHDETTQEKCHRHPLRSSDGQRYSSSNIQRHPRRYSLPNVVLSKKNHTYRLGICRALDLTGNPIEAFTLATTKPSTAPSGKNDDYHLFLMSTQQRSTQSPSSDGISLDLHGSEKGDNFEKIAEPISTDSSNKSQDCADSMQYDSIDDEPNDLKAQVVLEHLMKAADVASLMQRWSVCLTCYGYIL
jgi:hypothetical protein